MSNIILIGFMGSGKTTLGKLLADELKYTFIDSDKYIELLEKKSIPEIFEQGGETYFREKEKEFLLHAKLLDRCVISTGAGLPTIGNNMQQLNNLGTTIWLEVDESVLVERLKKEFVSRPKLSGFISIEEAVHSLLIERSQFYEQAKHRIKNPNQVSFIQMIKQVI